MNRSFSINTSQPGSFTFDELWLYISSEEELNNPEHLKRSCLAQGRSGINGFLLIDIASIYSVAYATHEQILKFKFKKDGIKKRQYTLKVQNCEERSEVAMFIADQNQLKKQLSKGSWSSVIRLLGYIGLTVLLTSIAYYFASNQYVGRRAIVHLTVELLQVLGGTMILIIGSMIMALQLVFFVNKKKYKNQIVKYN